jgi:uncharacterized protein DUF4331
LKKLALLGAIVGIGVGAVLISQHASQAADHLDAPTIKMTANRMADINDVYAWMTSDGNKVNLAMTVSPAEDGTHSFGPSVQYVFHVTTHPGATNAMAFGKPGSETRVICTFASNTSAQCWVAAGNTPKDYITGDPSQTSGVTNKTGSMRLFAGKRSDPFFFNLGGFLRAQATVEGACGAGMACPGALPHDAAGCPTLDAATAGTVAGLLSATPPAAIGPCAANVKDCFASFNTMAIVLQVDKTDFLGTGDHLLSVWGSTHATP